MFCKVISSAVFGVEGRIISVEADLNDGLPTFSMVGYLSSSVKEAAERVRTALKNSGFHLPPKRITINLSPADLRKDGAGFDLAIATAILIALGIEYQLDLEHTVILGELGLDGIVRPINGVLSMVSHCSKNGINTFVLPVDNVREASYIPDVRVIGVRRLEDLVSVLCGDYVGDVEDVLPDDSGMLNSNYDFSDVKGQDTLKRGLEIAAAGFHNVLLTGPAGAGKSMLVKRLPTIMPPMTYEESIEVTKIYSVAGLLPNRQGLIRERPFRAPHHTISERALIGGGNIPRPGEVSYSHYGILFLDEFPEFQKSVLEVLRQPIEDRSVTISRLNGTYVFPADFMLVAAMNPCPCGFYPDRARCKCTEGQVIRYQNKISGPLMDRIDIQMEVQRVKADELFQSKEVETSKNIRERVEKAREIQRVRYKQDGILFNSQLEGKQIQKYLTLNTAAEELIEQFFHTMKLSARGTHRVLKLARTIADLDGSESIEKIHLQEALFYRNTGNFNLSGGAVC